MLIFIPNDNIICFLGLNVLCLILALIFYPYAEFVTSQLTN